jgi:hypothetical protein
MLSLSFGREVIVPRLKSLEHFIENIGINFYEPEMPSDLANVILRKTGETEKLRALDDGDKNSKRIFETLPSWNRSARVISNLILNNCNLGGLSTEGLATKAPSANGYIAEMPSKADPIFYISIIVFGYKASDINTWLNRNGILRSRKGLRLILAYHVHDESISKKDTDLVVQGQTDTLTRFAECLPHVTSNNIMLIASDDIILNMPEAKFFDDSDFDVLVGRTYFKGRDEVYSASVTNLFEPSDDAEFNARSYWNIPSPGDNSIFYSIYRTTVFREHFARFVNVRFHALDWAWVHILLCSYKIEKSSDLVVLREKTPSHLYTSRLQKDFKLSTHSAPEEVIFRNPLTRAFKFILLSDESLGGCDIHFDIISQAWFQWFLVKQKELVLTLSPDENLRRKMFAIDYNYFIKILKESRYEEFSVYE